MLFCLPKRVLAGNDDAILLGNDAALVGGAVVSTVDDGSALWYNPAGLAGAKRDSVDVGANAFALRRYRIPSLISADGGHGGDASFTEVVTVPSALTYVRRLGAHLVGGLGLFASQVGDIALRTSLHLPVGATNGDVQALFTEQSARYHLAAGLSGKLPRGLTFGAALFGDYYLQSELAQAASQYVQGATTVGSSVTSNFEQDKLLGLHLRVGVVYEPSSGIRIGASIQSAGAFVYRSTRITGIDNSAVPNADGGTDQSASQTDTSASKLDFGRYAPWRARLGGSVAVAGGVLSLEGDVQSRVRDRAIDVDRVFTWNLRAGARFPISKTLVLGGGLFTDRGSDRKDALGAGSIDFYGCTIGGQYDNVRWLADDAGRSSERAPLTFSSTVALRYAYGIGKFAGEHLSAPDFSASSKAVDIGVHEITLHLGSGLYF